MEIIPASLYEYLALFLLCLVSFLIGWFFGRRRSAHSSSTLNEAKKSMDVGITNPPTMVRAIQTRRRGGEAVNDDDTQRLKVLHSEFQSAGLPEELNTIRNVQQVNVAVPEQKDDLKQINGIGPTIETKLNEMGIYSLEQVSNFTRSDIEKVAKHLNSFPKKIEKENWIAQARALLNVPQDNS